MRKILRNQSPAKAATLVTRAVSVPPAIDAQQLRQRLTQAHAQEERERLERDLGAALAQTKQAPLADESAEVRVAAVIQLADQATALAWLADLKGDDSLVEVALHARFAEVRRAAAVRLESKAALERAAEASRLKDKGVYRHCMTTLRKRQAASDNAARADILERELESLRVSDPVPAARLAELERELTQLGSVGHGHCSELFDQLKARLQEQSRARQRLHARQAEAQTLADELEHPLQEEQCARLQSRWSELADACAEWPAWLAGHKDLKSLQRLLGESETRMAQAVEDLRRLRQAEAFLATHAQEAPLTQESISAWAALAKPDNLQLQADLQSRWEAALHKAAQKAQKEQKTQEAQEAQTSPAVAPPIDRAALQKHLDLLEAALEQGHLAEAIKLELAIGLPGNPAVAGLSPALSQRLGRARAQLLQLRGWARWGSDQARQQLIAKAEQLAQGNPDVAALSGAIAELRKQWKGMDVPGAANHKLWKQFDAALEQAYAPVAAYRAELAAQRSAARLAKEERCLEWENWFVQINWEHADLQVIQTMRQELCVTWRAAPAADRRDERILQKRFGAILAGLDASVDAARSREVARREALIADAESLREDANLRRAIEGVKALQHRWRDEAGSVRLGRAEQEKLWQKFRGVCDAIFSRRAEEKAQHAAQRALRAEEERQRLAELDLQARQRRTPYELMAQKMAIAEQLESAAVSGISLENLILEAQATWRNLPRLPGKFEQALARRLADAPGAKAATLAEGLQVREGLLLDLEIALGLDSPDTQDASRRARHLELLQQRFRKSSSTEVDLDQLIIAWHATPAAVDEPQRQRMDAILRMRLADGDKIRKSSG
ncbi:MAG: hypothetical protein PHQ05_12655 [Sterolibacterium sp.]|nr:hypothetical protein [Sterolibacterium sp.]